MIETTTTYSREMITSTAYSRTAENPKDYSREEAIYSPFRVPNGTFFRLPDGRMLGVVAFLNTQYSRLYG